MTLFYFPRTVHRDAIDGRDVQYRERDDKHLIIWLGRDLTREEGDYEIAALVRSRSSVAALPLLIGVAACRVRRGAQAYKQATTTGAAAGVVVVAGVATAIALHVHNTGSDNGGGYSSGYTGRPPTTTVNPAPPGKQHAGQAPPGGLAYPPGAAPAPAPPPRPSQPTTSGGARPHAGHPGTPRAPQPGPTGTPSIPWPIPSPAPSQTCTVKAVVRGGHLIDIRICVGR